MSEPTSAYSFSDLITRIAKEAAIAYYGVDGDEKAMVPIDEHNLQMCKDIVNDGIKMFMSDGPVSGWRWMRRIMEVTLASDSVAGTVDSSSTTTIVDATLTASYDTDDDLKGYYAYITAGTGKGSYALITGYTALTGTITVADWLDENGNVGGTDPVADDIYSVTSVETVKGDVARYPLSENFGGETSGDIKYTKDSAHSAPIRWSDESTIRAKRAISVASGYPSLAAIRPFEPALSAPSAKRRFELFLDPEPSSAEILIFPYPLFFDKLDMESGTATGGSATTLLDDTRIEVDDYFNDWILTIISGTGRGETATITDYTKSSGTFTFTALSGGTTPNTTSRYSVEPANNLHPAGFRFDQAIMAACLAQAEMQADDIATGYSQVYMQKDLPKAHLIDARSAPRKLGNMGRKQPRIRIWNDVTYG